MLALLGACRDGGVHHLGSSTGETGVVTLPACEGERPIAAGGVRDRIAAVRLLGGRGGLNRKTGDVLWAGNLDADRCAEVLAVESDGTDERPGRISRVEHPLGSGLLQDVPALVLQSEDQVAFGHGLAVVDGELVVEATYGENHLDALYVFPADHSGSPLLEDDATGILEFADYRLDVSVATGSSSLGGRASVVTGHRHSLQGTGLWDGAVYWFDLPVEGWNDVEDAARAWYYGNPGDNAWAPHGEGDLDGDGHTDLAIGAYTVNSVGRVGVLTDPPEGPHNVWEVADAAFDGTAYGAEFGLTLSSGDLDGDGVDDLIVGAPISTDGGALYVFRGPVRSDPRTGADAEWTIQGGLTTDWTGYGAAVGDLDGDGSPDLAVGQPRNIYVTDDPGRVLLLEGPLPPGVYGEADAGVVVTNAVVPPDNDSFGRRVVTGDVDGDGADDLVVGALTDQDDQGREVGSVQILFGGADLFP